MSDNMKLRYFLPLFVAIVAMFTGCSTDQDRAYLGEIRLSQSYVALNTAGGSTQVTVTASDSWTVVADGIPSWLTVSPMSGSAGESTLTRLRR